MSEFRNPYLRRWDEGRKLTPRFDPQNGKSDWSYPLFEISQKFHSRNLSTCTKEMLGDLFEEIGHRDKEWEVIAENHGKRMIDEIFDQIVEDEEKQDAREKRYWLKLILAAIFGSSIALLGVGLERLIH